MDDRKARIEQKLCLSTEGQWIRFQQESGIPVDKIVENVDREIGGIGPDGKYTRIGVEYILGMRSAEELESLIED